MEEKYQCDKCGKFFNKDSITYMACEGLFCRICADTIYEQAFEGPFEYEDNGLNEYMRE
jgi:hypothetical protein